LDGSSFDPVSEPGLGDPTVTTIRSIESFKGKLFVSPTGSPKGKYSANIPQELIVLVSEDPVKGDWHIACEPFFGDPTNLGIFCMASFNGYLYAGTFNGIEGFQIWKTDAEGNPPYAWTKVLSHGGFRGKENEGVAQMVEFSGKLYIGTGILGGHDRTRKIGPASPELLRLHRDDSWDLIVGEPRHTPDGFKIPLSGLEAGFNSPTVGYFWRMCEHHGWLYLGTYDWTVWMPFARLDRLPEKLKQLIQQVGIEKIVSGWAGFDLWRSKNGVNWRPVTRNGFGNPCNFGVRTMASSKDGLFIGAANPFGPKMAVRTLSGWHYKHNPRGGLEIWRGGIDSGVPNPANRKISTRAERSNELIEQYYGQSGFRHCGLWGQNTETPKDACQNMMEELFSFIGEPPERVLEIGCGQGATSRAILDKYPGTFLLGLTRHKRELGIFQKNVPGARCRVVKHPKFKFKIGRFDCVISVEGFVAWPRRKKAFAEILRILKPGGRFLFSDVIFDCDLLAGKQKTAIKNIADSPQDYFDFLTKYGFGDVDIRDKTKSCWIRFHRHSRTDFGLKLASGQIGDELYKKILDDLPMGVLPVKNYLIGSASLKT
jgi:cyclopropane fatty-acyl-phospholipid synthase-like methyltransferase